MLAHDLSQSEKKLRSKQAFYFWRLSLKSPRFNIIERTFH